MQFRRDVAVVLQVEGLALALEVVEVAGLDGLPDAIVGKLGKKVHIQTIVYPKA